MLHSMKGWSCLLCTRTRLIRSL